MTGVDFYLLLYARLIQTVKRSSAATGRGSLVQLAATGFRSERIVYSQSYWDVQA